jgi:hypothetical protein
VDPGHDLLYSAPKIGFRSEALDTHGVRLAHSRPPGDP